MKQILVIILCMCMVVCLSACGKTEEEKLADAQTQYRSFRTEWSDKDIKAINARVEIDDNGDKILMADVQNLNRYGNISNLVVSFATWDADGNFIILKTKKNPDNTQAEFTMTLDGVTVESGATWIADAGIFLSDSCSEIAHVEAALVSWNSEENSMYSDWKGYYLEKPYEDWMKDIDAEVSPETRLAELRDRIKKQGMYVTKAEIWKKNLDEGQLFLTANVMNNTGKTVTELSLAFIIWDAQGNPIIIKSTSGNTPNQYVKEGNVNNISVANGQEWIGCEDAEGQVFGLSIQPELSNAEYIEAIVTSWTTDDGIVTENVCESSWEVVFGYGAILQDWMK